MKSAHPGFEQIFQLGEVLSPPYDESHRSKFTLEQTTSVSLARVLVAACLARLSPGQSSVSIWDPATGTGYAGRLLVAAMQSAGVDVNFRGQDISEPAVDASRRRFAEVSGAQIAAGDTLQIDMHDGFEADIVIVDGPWATPWASSRDAVLARHSAGEFRFGLPQQSDSSWLFISLALEKLRASVDGGGRIAALVPPSLLSASGPSGQVRDRIVEEGLLESVTRLPEGLAPTTTIPLYLVTFSNRPKDLARGRVMIADFQTQYTTEHRHRQILDAAVRELESGLRTGKPGPRNQTVSVERFRRREALLTKAISDGSELKWSTRTFNDTPIDNDFLHTHYGIGAENITVREGKATFDLDPGPILQDDAKTLVKELQAKGWNALRLPALLRSAPEAVQPPVADVVDGRVFVPTSRSGKVVAGAPDTDSGGRVLGFDVDDSLIDARFLTAWLNSDQGVESRRRAVEASSSGSVFKALRSDARSLMRWADELIVPIPGPDEQRVIADMDDRWQSFQEELSNQRKRVWESPEDAGAALKKYSKVFDDSLDSWLEELPYPVASALWTAQSARTSGEKLQSYMHAWEALVAFHATVLLSACRSDPGSSAEVEDAIRRTLSKNSIGMERASFGTWIIIIENTAKTLRAALFGDDAVEVARVRAAFSQLRDQSIGRLLDKEIVRKFNDVSQKRNLWQGHGGHLSEEERQHRIESLVSDLHDLKRVLGNVWSQLPLVRAGSARRVKSGYVQEAEVAVGTRSPFAVSQFHVSDAMLDGELYLVRDDSPAPLRLGGFVQLRSAPQNAQYTTYFYNRTDGESVRMVSYQYGPASEVDTSAEGFRDEFGALLQ